MIIRYVFSKKDYVYKKTIVVDASESYPSNSTRVPLPKLDDGQVAIWQGGSWRKEDQETYKYEVLQLDVYDFSMFLAKKGHYKVAEAAIAAADDKVRVEWQRSIVIDVKSGPVRAIKKALALPSKQWKKLLSLSDNYGVDNESVVDSRRHC